MGFNQYELVHHLPCQTSYASEASGTEEEDFNIFLCVSMVQTQNILGRIHFGLWGHYLNKLDEGPQGIPNFSQLSLERKIFKCILLAKPGSSEIGPF